MADDETSIEGQLPEVLLLEHARWLIDSQDRILSSLEARAGTVVAWGAAQVALNVGALALMAGISASWARAVAAVLLAAAAIAVAVGVAWVLAGVIRPRSMPAASAGVTETWNELQQNGFTHSPQDVSRILAGSVLAPGQSSGAQAVVEDMPKVVTQRARALKGGVFGIAVAVGIDALAAIFLTIAVLFN